MERFLQADAHRLLRLTSKDLLLAAELWAQSRQRGTPTADIHALDIDVILCAQVLNCGVPLSDLVIATTNAKHLLQFAPAKEWSEI